MSRTPSAPSSRRPVRGLVVLLLTLVAALGWSLGPASSVARADDAYVPPVKSTCGARLAIVDGDRLQAVVGAATSGNVPVTGEVDVRFTHDGETIRSVTLPYDGGRLVVDGPRIEEAAGTYGVTMRFTPDNDAAIGPCDADLSKPYAVLAGNGANNGGSDGGGVVLGENGSVSGGVSDGGGILPGTGGPALWLLILGLVLVAAGVPLLRRRRT